MPERLVVLVPPSLGKGAAPRSRALQGTFDQRLVDPRARVREALADFLRVGSASQWSTVFNARGALLERTLEATRAMLEGSAVLSSAWRRYQGVVWSYLDPGTLTPAQRRRIIVPSGLYGLLGGDDPIADYRLSMNASLFGTGPLASFWRPHLTAALLERSKGSRIINFLPLEHAASIEWPRLSAERRVTSVRFVASDETKAVGHDAKAIKGILAGAVLRDGLSAFAVRERLGWRIEQRDDEVVAIAPLTRQIGVRS